MKVKNTNSYALSETVSVILVIVLVLILAMVVYALLFGSIDQKYLKKSVYVAGSAAAIDLPSTSNLPDEVLAFTPDAGDPFYLTGQNNGITGTQVTLMAISPSGTVMHPNASTLTGSLYGKQLYIYPSGSGGATQCNYSISSTPPTGNLRQMSIGTWTVQLIDENVHVLAASFPASIKQGTTSLPVAGGFLTPGSSQLYDVDCTPINATVNGDLTSTPTGPGGMLATYFNGAS